MENLTKQSYLGEYQLIPEHKWERDPPPPSEKRYEFFN